MNVSDVIKRRIKDSNARAFANDNISNYINEGELDMLVDEVADKFTDVLKSLVIDIDNDPNSRDTGRRLAKMYIHEIMSGRYYPSPKVTAFPNDGSHGTAPYTGLLVVRAELKSICSHHHQPVTGTAYIGVIPTFKVIGLSKYIRLAQHCAARGTLQEELCNDIANSISTATQSDNVAVYIEAKHGCCENRGVKAFNSTTQTTVLRGMFHDPSVRDEFFSNIKLQKYQCK